MFTLLIHAVTCIYSSRLGGRMLTRRVMSQGMFPGAVVVRGADWRWGDQDGQLPLPHCLIHCDCIGQILHVQCL